MTHDPRPIIARFLGPEALEHGPFGLLGVSPDDCEADSVDAALQRQLDRIAAHREADTPAADDVRLALHAAAAQLLDPRVRAHLVDRWRGSWASAPARAVAVGTVKPTRAHTSQLHEAQTLDRKLQEREDDGRRELIRVLVFIGAAAMLMIALGLVAIVAIGPGAQGGGGGNAAQNLSTAPATPADVAPPALSEPAPTVASGAEAQPPVEAQAPRRTTTDLVDPRRTLHELRECAKTARSDPHAAMQTFDRLIRQLSDWWVRYDPAVRRACDDAVLEALLAMSADLAVLESAIESIAAHSAGLIPAPSAPDRPRPRLLPAEVWPVTWSVGMLTRLSRERDVPTSMALAVSDALDARLGAARPPDQSFEAGAAGALRRLPALLMNDRSLRGQSRDSAAGATGSTAALRKWIEACRALAPDDAGAERALVDGLEQILISCREPEEDLGVFEAVGVLVREIRWRAGGAARPRLLDWFRDPRISDGDLRVVTAALTHGSAAEGIDSTMIYSAAAGPDDRSRLRAAYAAAWGIESAGRQQASQDWAETARAAAAAPRPASPDELLRETAALARINEAARLIWRGEGASAASLLRDTAIAQGIGPGALLPPPAPVVHTFSMGGRVTNWAERYLAAERSIPARLELIAELDRIGRPIDLVAASVLAREAVVGSPIQVRFAAARLAGQLADEPTIVHALLDELPGAPRTSSLSELVERVTRQRLPKTNDPGWELAARRALVERLLGMLAYGSAESKYEGYALLIADCYLRSASLELARGAGAAAEGAVLGSRELWTAVHAEAMAAAPVESAPIPLDLIERRLRGRLSLAEGPVQVFAAHQVSIVEALSFVIAGERPTSARAVAGAIDRMQQERRNARHIFEQLHTTEAAALRLWMIRLGVEEGSLP
ncbi:MAG: hypothetical protein KF869_05710 [Phycisphaeraceae bacterium]|nr:hypothetical protein [Phycisphaeraceae bacterium]